MVQGLSPQSMSDLKGHYCNTPSGAKAALELGPSKCVSRTQSYYLPAHSAAFCTFFFFFLERVPGPDKPVYENACLALPMD